MAEIFPALLDALSWVCIVLGSGILITGAVGMLRLPDVFARMHAVGMIDTLGPTLLLVGMMFQAGLTLISFKLFLILVFLLYTSPTATHALARAALYGGVVPMLAVFGDGEDDSNKDEASPTGDDLQPETSESDSHGGAPSKA